MLLARIYKRRRAGKWRYMLLPFLRTCVLSVSECGSRVRQVRVCRVKSGDLSECYSSASICEGCVSVAVRD